MSFVLVSGKAQKDKDTRKFVRRHVMLGKNYGRTPKRPKQPSLVGATVFRTHKEVPNTQELARPPPPIGSDLVHLNFADTFNGTLQNETVRFCITMTENMFVLNQCIAFDSQDDWAVCLQPLCCDALYANAMVFGTQVYINKAFQQATSRPRNIKQGSQHYDKALRLLRERLPSIDCQQFMMFDAVILAVYTLAMHALIIGDLAAARAHVFGLSSLVGMRPMGAQSFRSRTKQMIELLRCDLSISLATGQSPFLSSSAFQQPSMLRSRSYSLPEVDYSVTYPSNWELVEIWQVLSQFCAAVNAAAAKRSRLSQDLLLETMTSAMYRALDLSLLPGSIDEAIRLAVLAFCAMIFLDWPLLRLPFPWLQHRLETAIVDLIQHYRRDINDKLVLWILGVHVIAYPSISLIHDDGRTKTRLQEITDRCTLRDWHSIKKIMSSFLWIDIVCDHGAQPFFDELLAKTNACELTTG